MDPLPPSIQSRLERFGASSRAPRARADAEVVTRSLTSAARVESAQRDRAKELPRAPLPTQRSSVAGASDTPVDPLQLIWLVAHERDDFANF